MNKKLFLLPALLSSALLMASAQSPAAAPMGAPPAAAPRGGPGMPGGPDGHRGPMGGPDARLLPPGTWWRNADVVSSIGLSTDQQKRIDGIFLDSRVQLIHMHASLEEEQLKLDSALQATPFNQGEALAQVNKIADTRADLEKANAKMLLTIRGVLSADQWTKLQAAGPGAGAPPPARDGGKRAGRGGAGRGGPGRSEGPGVPPPGV